MTTSRPLISLRRRRVMSALGWSALAGSASAAEPASPPRFSSARPGAASVPGWRHQSLPKVPRGNQFDIVDDDGVSVLHVSSQASASSWVCAMDHAVAERPWLQWRWKVSQALAGSDLRSKAGDDYAARLYVLFALPPERLSLADRLRLQAARLLSGAEVPAAALCYVWGRAQPAGSSGWNPYTDRVRMLVLDSGDAQRQQWRSHSRDLARDWAEAFGGEVPRVSGLAVSADTDNTGEQVEAWFGDLRLAASA